MQITFQVDDWGGYLVRKQARFSLNLTKASPRPPKVRMSGVNTRGRWIFNYSYDGVRMDSTVSARNEGREKEKLVCTGGEEKPGKGFIWPTVIKSVGRILAYHLDRKELKKTVSCDNGKFYIFTFWIWHCCQMTIAASLSADKPLDWRNVLATKSPQRHILRAEEMMIKLQLLNMETDVGVSWSNAKQRTNKHMLK